MTVEATRRDADLLAPAPRRWTPSVFGVVPEGARRRRPSDIVRAGFALLIVVITAIGADDVAALERKVFDVLADLPSWIRTSAEFTYHVGAIGTVVVLELAFLFTRRFRLLVLVGIGGLLGWAASAVLRAVVDADAPRRA